MESKVLQYINRHNLFYPGEKVVVAVSGGADSICLLNILHGIREELSISLHAAHLDHMLRGKESKADAAYVSRLCRKLGIPATIEAADVGDYSRKRKLATEEAARELRYAFFGRVIAEQEAGCVAVAHTRNDNVETIILHLIRGTGIAGLRGLQPRSVLQMGNERLRINVIRPLLELTRADIEKYCSKLRLKPRLDSSNTSTNYTRNRIRHELIPLLHTYNSRIDDALLRLSAIARDEMEFLEEQTAQVWSEIAEEEGAGLTLDVERLSLLPAVMQNQVLRWAIKFLCGDTRDIEAEHIEDMARFLNKPAGKMLALPHGIRLHKGYGRLTITLAGNTASPFPALDKAYSIKIPGETILPGWMIKASISGKPPKKFDKGFTASFDFARTGRELTVRNCEKGDSFRPLGMEGQKNVLRFMSDSRIPRAWRSTIPLVCSGGKVIWVAGWRMDESVKITRSTQKVLRLSFERTA